MTRQSDSAISDRGPSQPAASRWDAPIWSWLAASWMVLFGAIHVYWALGGRLLLPHGFRVTDRTALLVVDIIAIPMCLAGALVAASFVHQRGKRISSRWRLLAGWSATAVALVHSGPSIIEDLGRATGLVEGRLDTYRVFSDLIYEPWWFVGGLLFLVATNGLRRRTAAGRARPGVPRSGE